MNKKVDAKPATSFQALEEAALLLGQGDDGALFSVVLEALHQFTGAGQVSLLVTDPGSGELRPATDPALASNGGKAIDALPVAAAEQALTDGEAQFIGPNGDPTSGLILPLVFGGRSVGLIYASRCSHVVDDAELARLKALSGLAAAALERANLLTSVEEIEKARRNFVSLTTHELRVPLTAISGYTDLMLTGIAGSLTDRQKQFTRTVQRNVDRMAVLINDLGDLNRIQDGRMPLDIAAVDMRQLVEEVLQEQAGPIEVRGHELQSQLPDGLPAARADRHAVKRVLTKLLDNAIRYTPSGGSLAVAAVHHGRRLQVTVADNGIGIDEGDQAQLYTPFFRSEVEAVREHAGWGLSLALASALIGVQGGELWCESEPGAGAVFHFTLPAAGTESSAATSSTSE